MARPIPVLYLLTAGSDSRIFEPLRRRYPEARLIDSGLEVPLAIHGPEEVLASCCAARVPVRASIVRLNSVPDAAG